MTRLFLALLAVLISAISGSSIAVANCEPMESARLAIVPAMYAQGYWTGFVDFWTKAVKNQDAVILMTIGLGAISIMIICWGRSRK